MYDVVEKSRRWLHYLMWLPPIRGPWLSARRLRDAVLVEHIGAVHQANYGVYGVRKMWHALRREGIDIGRKQTASD